MKRKIVTLCGSTRFYEQFQRANYEETMEGHIVLSVGFYRPSPESRSERERYEGSHGETWGCTPEQKRDLDQLHFDKIRMSDEILVLNADGYVGESTRNEIVMAMYLGKGMRWLEPEAGEAWLEARTQELGKAVAKLFADGVTP